MNVFIQDPIDHNREKRICNWLLVAVLTIYILAALFGCKVHKAVTKEKSNTDVVIDSEQTRKIKSDSVVSSQKENFYKKVTIELGDKLQIDSPQIIITGSQWDTQRSDVAPDFGFRTLPKGTKITYETGTQKETTQAEKTVNEKTQDKEEVDLKVNSKTEDKKVEKKLPVVGLIGLFLLMLIIALFIKYRKKIFSQIRIFLIGI